MPVSADFKMLANRLDDARRVLVITGAGLSADSGLPVYRGSGGLYDSDHTESGFSIEEILSCSVFKQRPALTWKYLTQLGRISQKATFNRGHQVLQELERFLPEFLLVTQNVDGLHQQAGSHQLVEMHGSIRRLYCPSCSWRRGNVDYESLEALPHCNVCGGLLRPEIILYDEMLPAEGLERYRRFLEQPPEICLLVGTSCQFPYLAMAAVETFRSGGLVVEINPCDTQISELANPKIRLGAAESLDAVWNQVLGLDDDDVAAMREVQEMST